MTAVNYETGEITGSELAPVEPSSAIAVTSYLERARTWLATAVEQTGPEQIARAKAEIATAAEATKQLGLSKEIRDDAQEMVRRAEYALTKAVRKSQAEGSIRDRRDNLTPGQGNPLRTSPADESKASPSEFFNGPAEQRDAYDMAEATEEQFEAALTEAKAEGNLSRANVARRAREKSGNTKAKPRRPLTDSAHSAGWELRKAVERLQRIAADDRFAANKEQMAPQLRSHLTNAVEVCQDLLDRLTD